ncbi:hypothetical protein L0657_24250 [Dyadobacter sp. CY345]|uniref:hypothetical protein n=1 Tax=Dyadobacter sp. CY345 TaxID=2909335 RepID=UPI001F1A5618|nr:hypothetical protein [Dyadobacter sp. CY345]MCF2447088.1 hypothetical protein [Dyadobacter sp. CY345]
MANTVVAIFDSKNSAEQAEQYLISAGYSPSQIEMKIASYKNDAPFPVSEQEDAAILDKITAFFKDLFGADHEEVSRYAHASKAGVILTVHTETHNEAEKVSEMLDAYGAEDATEHSEAHAGGEVINRQHSVSDHGENFASQAGENQLNNAYRTRASSIKSRIVERNLDKQRPASEF